MGRKKVKKDREKERRREKKKKPVNLKRKPSFV